MVGQQIGPYRILKLLGKGGMGIVYQGMHAKLEQLVAIKVLSPEFCENSTMRERFVQEAKLQVKLSHPNVVNILNYLEDNRNIYLIMEYIQGETLEARLRRSGALPVAECCRITVGVLEALSFMHRQGIIHRDIKPSNIMITDSGQIKVTDFGIAKATGEKGLTRTGTQLGTVWYMSPEQIRGAQVSAASDIYALGVTLFQMATGKVPFQSESDFEIMKAHVEQQPPDPEALNPLIPPMLTGIILKALAKNSGDRYGSADELKSALFHLERQSRTSDSLDPGSAKQDSLGSDAISGPVPADVAALEGGMGEYLIFGRLEKRHFLILLAMAAVLLVVLLYLFSSSELFKKEKKEEKHTIPLTSVSPESSGTPSSKESGKSTLEEPASQKSTQEDIERVEDSSQPVEKVESSPQTSPEDRNQTIATTSEEEKTVSKPLEEPRELITTGDEKLPKEIFDKMFGSGDMQQVKEESIEDVPAKPHYIPQNELTGKEEKAEKETEEQKKKTSISKEETTPAELGKKQSTKSRVRETAKGSSSATKSRKGETKGWAIIK